MTVVLRKKKKTGLVESGWTSVEGSRIDTEKGIIRGVKVLGFKSKHGYSYTPDAMKRALPLYEGIRVNMDHPTKTDVDRRSRAYADRFGRIKNARFVEGKGIYGDLHYNKKHRLAEQFEYDAEHAPENVGLSHNAYGDVIRRNGRQVVESIDTVQSVDLVADPATNTSLFESDDTTRKPRVKRRKPQAWEKLMESLGMELGETPTPREAIAKLMESIMLDGSLTPAQRKEKILKCLEMDVADKNQTRVEESEDMTKKPNSKKAPVQDKATQRALREAAKLRQELDARKRDDRVKTRVTKLCESMDFKPSEIQLKAIKAMGSKVEAKKLIEGFMGEKKKKSTKETSNKPKSRPSGEHGSKRLTEAELDQFLEGVLE